MLIKKGLHLIKRARIYQTHNVYSWVDVCSEAPKPRALLYYSGCSEASKSRALYIIQRALSIIKKALYILKEPCVLSKEPRYAVQYAAVCCIV